VSARANVLAARIFTRPAHYPSAEDVAAAGAEVRTSGVTGFDDLVVLGFAQHFDVLTEADAQLITPIATASVSAVLAARPRIYDTDLRQLLRLPGYGTGMHLSTDNIDAQLLVVLDLLAQHAPTRLSDVARMDDPSHVFERWAMSAEPRRPATSRIIVEALLARSTDLSALTAGSILARAGTAYVRSEPTWLRLFVPRIGSGRANVFALGFIATEATSLSPSTIAPHRWHRYGSLIQRLARLLLSDADAVSDFRESIDEKRFNVFCGAFCLKHAAGAGLARAKQLAGEDLGHLFAPLEHLSDEERLITDWHMKWATQLARNLPLTRAKFEGLSANLQCDRLTRAISVSDYESERRRLIQLTAIALTLPDPGLRDAAFAVCTRLGSLPAGHEAPSLGGVDRLLDAAATAALPRL